MKKLLLALLPIIVWGYGLREVPAAAEMKPKEILIEADKARGNLKGVAWLAEIESIEKGRKQFRALEIKNRGTNTLAKFVSPAKVKGRKLLMLDRNMWFIKPGLRKPMPISPMQKLMGGASYGDIASTNYAGDYHADFLVKEEINGEQCFLFDLVAKNKKATYDRIRYWISERRLVGVKSDFYSVSGKLFKSATFEYDNRIAIDGAAHLFVSKMIISDALSDENVTTLSYSKIKLKNIPDSTFNLNLLIR